MAAGGVTYTYDFLNSLTSATGGITLVYDGDGNRVQETAGGTTTQYLVDDNNPSGYPQVVEEISGGAVQRTYTYGRALISQTQVSGTPTTRFYGDDGLGSVRLLTDASGTKTDSYDYDAFGNVIASTGTTPNNYRFTGEQSDPNLGLYYLRARYYNAGVGRFWTRDTAEINPDDPRELNRYVYVANNPVNDIDPTGTNTVETGLLYSENSGRQAQIEALGDEAIIAETRVEGNAYATQAKQIAQELRTALGPKGGLMKRVTIAVSEVDGESMIAINGNAPEEAINVFRQLYGNQATVDPFGLHAEATIYERALTVANREGIPVRTVIRAIGISNSEGPCLEFCAPLFKDIGYIPVYIAGRLLVWL